ncbi:hypothetical protein LSAT2_006491, partial [Lamellibrachia satsuma]
MVVTLVTRNRKIKVIKVAKNLKGNDEWKHVLIGERETVSIQKRTRGKKGKGEKTFSSSRAALQSPGRTRHAGETGNGQDRNVIPQEGAANQHQRFPKWQPVGNGTSQEGQSFDNGTHQEGQSFDNGNHQEGQPVHKLTKNGDHCTDRPDVFW